MASNQKPETTAPKPSEEVDEMLEVEELRQKYLGDLPDGVLLPPHRFRISQRHAFQNLVLNAIKDEVFEGLEPDDEGTIELDGKVNPEDIEKIQKVNAFLASIDEWAESIAIDKDAYVKWSEGKVTDHFMVLFRWYRVALGESQSSSN